MSGPAPKPIRHGTDSGYMAHLRRNIPPCDDCKAAHTATQIARRRTKHPARNRCPYTAIPTTVLADLYLHAHPDAQQRAEESTPDGVLQLAVTRYDQENP